MAERLARWLASHWAILAVIAVGLVFRVAWLAAEPHPYTESGMAQAFGGMAQQIEQGRGFVFHEDERVVAEQSREVRLIDPGSPNAGSPSPENALVLPGIPIVMAAMWKVTGDHFMPVQVLMVLLDTLNVWLCYLVGRRLLTHGAGLVAAGVYAVFPLAVNYADSVTDGTPSVTVVLLTLCVAAGMAKRPERWRRSAVMLAVIGGIGAYVRSNALVFALAAAVGLFPLLGWRRGMRVALVTAGVGYALFMPWVIRDAIDLHAFLPEGRTGLGQTMYEGLSERPSDAATLAAVRSAGIAAPYGSVAYDNTLRAWFVASPPDEIARAWLRHAGEAAILTPRGNEPSAVAALMLAMGRVLALLAVVGALLSWRQWRRLFVILLPAFVIWAAQIPFLTSQRFALSILPIQALLAALALVALKNFIGRHTGVSEGVIEAILP